MIIQNGVPYLNFFHNLMLYNINKGVKKVKLCPINFFGNIERKRWKKVKMDDFSRSKV